jgi:DNA polymerase-3 subunit alpha
MASVLTNNQNNIEKITFFIDECKRQEIEVLGPDINESSMNFDVNKEGKIRFGLGAIKGSGEAAVEAIVSEREENGPYTDIFNFSERVNLRTVNKKTFESLAMAGAFDGFPETHRNQFIFQTEGETNLIELSIRYGNNHQQEKDASQQSLFGGKGGLEIPKPKLPQVDKFTEIEKLKIEKDVVGFYISGHPLDQFQVEFDNFCTCSAENIEDYKSKVIHIGGIVVKTAERLTKRGQPFGLFSIEDFRGTLDMALFGEEYLKNKHFLVMGNFLYLTGRVEERYNQPGLWEFRPKAFHLLTEIRNELSKEIELQVDASMVNSVMVEDIERIATTYHGKCLLKLVVYDTQEQIKIDLMAKKYLVEPKNEFFEEIGRLDGIESRVISKGVEIAPDKKPAYMKYAKA